MVTGLDICKPPPQKNMCLSCGKSDQWLPWPEISDNKLFLKCKCGVGSITLEFDRPITLGDFFPAVKAQIERLEAEKKKALELTIQ